MRNNGGGGGGDEDLAVLGGRRRKESGREREGEGEEILDKLFKLAERR